MATVNLEGQGIVVDTSHDCITIRQHLSGKAGGAALDVTGFKPTVIKAGHVVIKETATGTYKPMPVNEAGSAYAALPAGHTYYGVVVSSRPTSQPSVAIMYRGEVNENASPYPVTAEIKAALSKIEFTHD